MRRSSRNPVSKPKTDNPTPSDELVFEDLVFSGSTQVMKTVSKLITDNGGKVSNTVSKNDDFDKPTAKLKKAIELQIPIVSDEFIKESIDKEILLDYNAYIVKVDDKQSPKRQKLDAVVEPDSDSETAKETTKETEKVKEIEVVEDGKVYLPDVDTLCPNWHSKTVFYEGEQVYDAMLNQTDIKANANKFYILQLLQDKSGNEWGRVGVNGQNSFTSYNNLASAKKQFMAKFKDKYFLIERDFSHNDEIVEEKEEVKLNPTIQTLPESKLNPQLKGLMELIFNMKMMEEQMNTMGYDAKKMPLGKLSKSNIQKGYNVLKQISDVLNQVPMDGNLLTDLSSEFYTIIPHAFGFKKAPVINTAAALATKLSMVEALADIEIAANLIKSIQNDVTENPIDRHYQSLNRTIEPIDKKSDTYFINITYPRFKLLDQYLHDTHGQTHSHYKLEILDAFECNFLYLIVVDHEHENKRFDVKVNDDKLDNKMLLWHGSRLTNFVGILSQGLRIAPPEAPVTGYMFGKGVYFADMVSKSANYCFTSRQNNVGILLLCEVALGKTNELFSADYDAAQKLKTTGCHSTLGVGRTKPDPKTFAKIGDVTVPVGKPVDADLPAQAYLQYNEYIVCFIVLLIHSRFIQLIKSRSSIC
ncbi:Poly [ADP-ribose] polymerase 2 [Globomyces sp. JEL0801]|nr:Poly [ADP-ribose] polymerase 2 [Globomyces sp. JEL0801]